MYIDIFIYPSHLTRRRISLSESESGSDNDKKKKKQKSKKKKVCPQVQVLYMLCT